VANRRGEILYCFLLTFENYSYTLVLSYSYTLVLSYSYTLVLSYSYTLVLSYSYTLVLRDWLFVDI
jgi:hypothetical protein